MVDIADEAIQAVKDIFKSMVFMKRRSVMLFNNLGHYIEIRSCIKTHFLCSCQTSSEATNVDKSTMYKIMHKR
jgi:hypothetical protein